MSERSSAPAKTTPPAVASAPVDCGARCRSIQTVLRVSRLMACTRPYLPSLSGRGRRLQRTPLERLPRPPGATGVRSMHASTIVTYRILVRGLYEDGSHDLAPPACGQVNFVVPSPGTSEASIVLAPVTGSTAFTTFCTPRSNENTYFPVSASIASKMACLPPVTTTGLVLPFTGSGSTCRSNAQS